jgi:two-component system chemotaxis sensor kinase CheA
MTAPDPPYPQAGRALSIGGKLALGTSLVLALVTAVVYVGLSRAEHEKLIAAKEQAARMAGALFVRFAATPVLFDDETGIKDTTALLAQEPDVLGVELWRVKASGAGLQIGERLMAQFKDQHGLRGGIGIPPELVNAPVIERRTDRLILRDAIRDQDGQTIAVVVLQYTLHRERRVFLELRRRILLASAALYVLVAALLLLLGRRWITGPLQRLFQAVRKVEAGERVDLDLSRAQGGDEIGRLAGAFARMAGAVDRRERDIVRRNDDMRLILDNIAQGLLRVTRQGALLPEHSAILETWFGPWAPGETLWSYLGRRSPRAGAWIGALWSNISEDLFPIEVALGQMPSRIQIGEQTYDLSFRPILPGLPGLSGLSGLRGEELTILVVISDVTLEVEQEQTRLGQQEMVSLFHWMVQDRTGLLDFLADADRLVLSVTGAPAGEGVDLTLLKREVHTLKGNSGIFGLSSVVAVCQDIEARFEEGAEAISEKDREALLSAWARISEWRRQLLPEEGPGRIEIDLAEHQALLAALAQGVPPTEIERRIRRWTLEPARQRLTRIGEQARALARRLGRGEIALSIEAGDVRLPDGVLAEFWASFAHLVRNAVDHGLETPEERQGAGKSPLGTLHLLAAIRGESFLIEIEDDGRGIDWGKLRERARAAGLPAATRADLVEALFADGISTKEGATEISGRGVGMSAVRAACEKTGGRIRVDSEPGQGTRFQFSWPASVLSIPTLSRPARGPVYRSSQETREGDCAEQ